MKRTDPQNNALHLYFDLLAEALNDAGIEKVEVIEEYKTRGVEVPWDKDSVKIDIWKVVQKAMRKGSETSSLEKLDVDKVYKAVDRFISEGWGVHVEFPNREEL